MYTKAMHHGKASTPEREPLTVLDVFVKQRQEKLLVAIFFGIQGCFPPAR